MGRSQLDCSCGGRLFNEENKRMPAGKAYLNGSVYPYDTWYTDYSDPRVNKMRCNKCGRRVQWKRRQKGGGDDGNQ